MKKVLSLITAVICLSVTNAQFSHQKDPYVKTFVQDSKSLPDQQLQDNLRDGQAWSSFKQAHGDWWVEFNEQTGKPHRAFGSPIVASGASPAEQALNFLTNEVKGFNPETSNLVITLNRTTDKYHYVSFKQQYNGLDVLWSEATVRLSLDGKVVMFGLDTYSGIATSILPAISSESIKTYAKSDFTIAVTDVVVSPELKILPLPGEGAMEFKLVYEVNVFTTNADNLPGNYYSLVDANTGQVYYRHNMVKACGGNFAMTADLQINSVITDNPLLATENRGLPYIRVEIDGDFYYADANGFLTFNTITEPTPATIDLRGLYARVSEGAAAAGTNIESLDIIINPGDNTIEFDDESGALASEVSPYYWQNRVHDLMKDYWPAFDDLDVAQLIRVERNDGTCNAFYDGVSTNFYEEGGGCPSTSLFHDVVMHEYGHGINSDLYSWLGDPGGMSNGAMNEAYADIWGISVTDFPIIAQGFFGGAGTFIRRYDLAPKVFPIDLVGEVHADGEIIAGAWWDVQENMDHEFMVDLFNETQNGIPDASDGNEGELFRDVLLEALMADDDNADLADGTPNDDAITSAFCEHGITLIGNLSLDHTEFTEPVDVMEPILVETDLDVDFPEFVGATTIFWRNSPGAAFTSTIMTEVGGSSYETSLPAQPQGTIIEYYFKIEDTNECGGIVLPAKADQVVEPNLPFFILVGYELLEFEDFDNVFGSWEVNPFGTDNAITGEWDVNTPISSTDATGYQIQTDEDHTEGTGNLCAFTGNAGEFDPVGDNDVDQGKTTLRTPFFDVTEYTDPVFTYYRRYSNASPTSANPGNDIWRVFITDNGTDWVRVENTHTEDNTWRRNTVRILDYVGLTDEVSMIFVAQDSFYVDPDNLDGGSLVEAAIDDLYLYDWAAVDTTEDTTTQAIDENIIITGVFPNPANETVNVFFGNINGDVEIIVTNALGEIILTDKITVGMNSMYTFNSANYAQGIYTLSAKSNNSLANKRIIIQH